MSIKYQRFYPFNKFWFIPTNDQLIGFVHIYLQCSQFTPILNQIYVTNCNTAYLPLFQFNSTGQQVPYRPHI